jgi:hypothetical protein
VAGANRCGISAVSVSVLHLQDALRMTNFPAINL